jgi:hypothetical protein
MVHDWYYREEDKNEVQAVTPFLGNKNKRTCVSLEDYNVIQEQSTKTIESSSLFI